MVKLNLNIGKKLQNIPTITSLIPIREEYIDIDEQKKKDLLTMIKYLPEEAALFYKEMCK